MQLVNSIDTAVQRYAPQCPVEVKGQPQESALTLLRQGLPCSCHVTVCPRLAGPPASCNSPVSTSHLTIAVLGFQMHTTASSFQWIPGKELMT